MKKQKQKKFTYLRKVGDLSNYKKSTNKTKQKQKKKQ